MDGVSAIIWATEQGRETIVEQVLADGADAGLCDRRDRTVYEIAQKKGREGIACRLQAARCVAADDANQTPGC